MLLDLGEIHEDFEQLIPFESAYVKDSTLLIHQQDLDDQSLTLQFHSDRTYSISRLNRQLDHGYWFPFLMGQSIVLKSAKKDENSDGVYGGIVDITSLKRNSLSLKRRLKFQKNEVYYTDYSYLETYKPYRKR